MEHFELKIIKAQQTEDLYTIPLTVSDHLDGGPGPEESYNKDNYKD